MTTYNQLPPQDASTGTLVAFYNLPVVEGEIIRIKNARMVQGKFDPNKLQWMIKLYWHAQEPPDGLYQIVRTEGEAPRESVAYGRLLDPIETKEQMMKARCILGLTGLV